MVALQMSVEMEPSGLAVQWNQETRELIPISQKTVVKPVHRR